MKTTHGLNYKKACLAIDTKWIERTKSINFLITSAFIFFTITANGSAMYRRALEITFLLNRHRAKSEILLSIF